MISRIFNVHTDQNRFVLLSPVGKAAITFLLMAIHVSVVFKCLCRWKNNKQINQFTLIKLLENVYLK